MAKNVLIKNINATLYQRSKVRAAQMNITLKQFIEDALRSKLITEPEPKLKEDK